MNVARITSPWCPVPTALPAATGATPTAGTSAAVSDSYTPAQGTPALLAPPPQVAVPMAPTRSLLRTIVASSAVATSVACSLLGGATATAAPAPLITASQTVTLNGFGASGRAVSDEATSGPITQVDLHARPLSAGMSGSSITRLQKGLARWQPDVTPSGVFDAQTVKAVRAFQKANHLQVTGKVDNMTYGVLWNRTFWEKGVALDLNDASFYASLPDNVKLKANLDKQRVSLIDAGTGRVIKTYPISSGRAQYPTPTGTSKIGQVREKPTWYPPSSDWAAGLKPIKPGPNNPLGPAAMRLGSSTVLFHGVPRASWGTIGKSPQSHGCMRMFPQDAWELHNIVSVGTVVEVR